MLRVVRSLVASVFATLVLAGAALFGASPEASAHRESCHRARTCPADHANYRWRGLLCVSATARERTPAFRLLYVYATYVYYCKR